MAESQLRTLYESLRRDNYDVPGTYESFERTLTAPGKEGVTNRQTLYNSLHADGYDVPDTYESFANTLFVPQPKQQTAPASQAVAEAPAPIQKTQAATKAPAPVRKAQPQVKAQPRPTSQQPTGTIAAFKLRRGGHDFYVTQQEVNEAGGLGAWAAKHPGAPVRVYMHGDGFTGHVDLSEASKRRKEKGYKYTLEYRPGHKVKRNKSGWVDNLVEYGQEAKAIEEMTAPTKQVVEQLWSAAEKKQTTDARNNYDALNNKWSRTGDDMPFVDSSVRYLANETDRMKNFDLDKMSDEAWRRSGAALTQKVYQRLKLANPKTDDTKLIEQAEAEAWRLTNKAVYDYAVEKNMPKSALEYFFKKVMDQNSVVSLLRGTARSMAGTTGDRGAYEAAQEEYGKKHKVADVAGTVVGMGADPMMTLTGGAGGAAGKAVLNVGGRLIARKAAGTAVETGTRLFANKLGARVAAGVASGSVNLGMYEGLKEGERQFLHGGYINPETGQNEGYSLRAMFESAGKGAILGAATGVISPIFGNVGNKLVGKADRISSAGGGMAAKAGIRATQHLVATGLEGTIFATEGWLTTDEDKMDVWLDSMATMIGFKGHHIIRSAPRVIAGMRPVKPTADRPLTMDERNFNRKSFVERVSAMLDGPKFADERRNGSGMPLSFTKDDISTLKEAGYGSLADIFRSDRAKEADKPFEERVLDVLGEDESTAEMSNDSGGLLDGYSEMEKLVKDARVPQEIRAKAYYALTGHCLGAGTITGHATRETDDGRIVVDALTNNGEIVYRRYYKSKDSAKAATEKLDRQIELNKIDVGEQYADAVADETILDDVIKAQYPDNNPEDIKKIYYGVKYGKARADEHLRKGIDAIDKEIAARKDEAADMRPDAIRKAYGEEYGVDIDDAIRKPSGDRSEAEKRAVESYIARLFASGETRVDRYDSKSDSYVSDVSDVADAADQPERQPIGRATMKFQDRPVEVLSGRVVMTEDGKMVDVERSDKTIVVRDPATGKTEMVSPEAMLSYEDVAPEVAEEERPMPKYSSGLMMILDNDGKERRGFLTGEVDDQGRYEYYLAGDLNHLFYATEEELDNRVTKFVPDRRDDVSDVSDVSDVADEKQNEVSMPTGVEAVGVVDVAQSDGYGRRFTVGRNENGDLVVVDERGYMWAHDGNGERMEPYRPGANVPVWTEEQIDNLGDVQSNDVSDVADVSDERVGRSLNTEEAQRFIDFMEAGAEVAPELELTPENWKAQFGEDGIVNTPIGAVKQGDNQYLKLAQQGRNGKLGMIKPTLEHPFIIIEDERASNDKNSERDTSYVFIRTFLKKDGSRYYHFASVTVSKDGKEVVISSQERSANRISKLLQQGKVAWIDERFGLHPKSQIKESVPLNDSNKPTLTDNQLAMLGINSSEPDYSSDDKGSDSVSDKQVSEAESSASALERLPRDEKGEPIFEQAETPEDAWDALVEFSDGDVADAREMADIITEQKRKGLEKLQKQKPKGASLAELRESQKVIKAAREQAEQEYNFWQQMAGVEQFRQEAETRRKAEERAEADRAEAEEKKRKAALDKRLRDTFEDVKDVPEAVEVLEDMDPRDIYEAAAQLLSGQKVLWGDAGVKVGARSETGFGEEERRRFFGLFASEANGGKSLSRLAEDAMKQQCETYGIPYDNQDARNALIDVISGARTVGDIRNYIANNRIDEARRLAEAKRRHEEEQYDEFCRQEYHLSAEEVEAYEDQLLAELSERDREFDANEYNDYIADEMARAAEITEQQKNETEDNTTRRGSTSGDRRVQENDTEGKGTVPGRGYEVLPESRADQSSGAAADGDRSGIQPADGVQGDGSASAVAQVAQRGGIAAVGRRKADDSPYGGLAEEVTSAIGPFGKIYTQFRGKPREAVTFLLAKRDGEAIGALNHKDVGEIDLVWGDEGSAHSDGFGLAKLAKYHPEVLFNLQEILNDMAVTKRSANRVQLESAKYKAAVRLTWDNQKKTWLLTMFEKKNSVLDNTTDTDKTHKGNGNDTATPENTVVSGGKDIDFVSDKQGDSEKSSANGDEALLKLAAEAKIRTEAKGGLQAAVEAASAEVNTEPTEAQKKAGNYKKGHVTIGSFDITIENPAGSVRRGVDADGKEWSATMANAYGEIRGTQSVDGDPIDVFLATYMDAWNGRKVFVVDQTNTDGSFDEHKVMLGFNDKDEAMSAYLANYDKTWADTHPGLRITEASLDDFQKWVESSHRKTKAFADYSMVKGTAEAVARRQKDEAELRTERPERGANYDMLKSDLVEFAKKFKDAGTAKIPEIEREISEWMSKQSAEDLADVDSQALAEVCNEAGLDRGKAWAFRMSVDHATPKKVIEEVFRIRNVRRKQIAPRGIADVDGFDILNPESQAVVQHYLSQYGSKPIRVIVDMNDIVALGFPKEVNEAFEEVLNEGGIPAVYNHYDKKIYIFANVFNSARRHDGDLFHENVHGAIDECESYPEELLLSFRRKVVSSGYKAERFQGLESMLKKEYDEDSVDEEFLAYTLQWMFDRSDRESRIMELLSDEEKEFINNNILNKIRYAQRRRTSESASEESKGHETLHASRQRAGGGDGAWISRKATVGDERQGNQGVAGESASDERSEQRRYAIGDGAAEAPAQSKNAESGGKRTAGAAVVKGPKWEATGKPERFKFSTKKGDSHDVIWPGLSDGKRKNIGSTTAERDTIEWLIAEFGSPEQVWNAYESGKVFLGKNEAAIVKLIIEKRERNGYVEFSVGAESQTNEAVYDAAKGLLESAGIAVHEVSDAEARTMLDNRGGDERLMGSRTDRKMAKIAEHYADRELDDNQQTVVDVFSGKRDNVAMEVERAEGKKRIVMRQGQEQNIGAKHSLLRHFETRSNYVTADEIAMIPEIIAKGERIAHGKKIAYDYTIEDGSRLRVTTEISKGRETFTNLMSNRKPQEVESSKPFGDTQSSAQATTSEVSAANVGEKNQIGKSTGKSEAESSADGLDKEYLEAVERGDIEKAQTMVNEAAGRAGYSADSEYQGTSAFNGAAPYNGYGWSKEERKEHWDRGDFEGDWTLGDQIDGMDNGDLEFRLFDPRGERSLSASGRESARALRAAYRNAKRKITVYRSVPSDVKEGSLRDGDWVTPSRSYAKDNAAVHGWGRKYRIIEQEVDVDDLWWDGNDINEWGYDSGSNMAYRNTKNNRKLLEAVTYDDKGNVIPLSQRFDSRKEDVRYMRTASGMVYGWTVDGEVWLNRDAMNPETPLHEYTHLWDEMVRRENPELWARGKELMKETPLWQEVMDDPNYADIRDDEDAVASEVHSRLTGRDGAKHLQDMIDNAKKDGALETAKTVMLVEKLKSWLSDMFKTLKATLGKWSKRDLKNLTVEDFNHMVIRDLAEGINPRSGDKTLVAVHNMSEAKLREALDLGGFPMPSIAVTKASMGHTEFGEISLVFGKESIDPRDRRNKVYSGDAWSPTFPTVGYKLNSAKTSEIYERANNAGRLPLFRAIDFHPDNYERRIESGGDGSLVEAFLNDYSAKQLYLSEKGEAVTEYERHEVEKYSAEKVGLYEKMLEKIGEERLRNESYEALLPELKKLIGEYRGDDFDSLPPAVAKTLIKGSIRNAVDYADNGNLKTETDIKGTEAKIDGRIDRQEYRKWLEELFAGVVEKKGIRNERDMFTLSGNSRKWESLYDAVTLDNVVKAMRRQTAKGGTGIFNSSIFGASTRELKDIDDVRDEAKARIASISSEEYEAEKDRIMARLGSVEIPSANRDFSSRMDFVENVTSAVAKTHTANGIYRYLKIIYPDMTMDAAREIAGIVGDIEKMSTRYFEAKPQRAVSFGEVKLAVVPEGTSAEIVEQLERHGIQVRTYERGNERQRTALVSRATSELGLRFHAAMARGRENFDAMRERAVRERGIVMPGLNEAEVRVVDVPRHDFAGTGKEALKAAEKWAKSHITGTHTATDSRGEEFKYSISNDAVEKYVSRSATDKSENIGVHLAALKKLPEIISESVEAEVHAVYKKENGIRTEQSEINAESLVHRFYGAAKIDGTLYRVKTTMREYADANMSTVTHSYEVTGIELLEAPSDNTKSTAEPLAMTSNSSINVANLLKGVEKSYDPEKKLLDESEPGTEYGASPEGDIRFREVEDDAVLKEFAEGKTVKAYRTMQVIDGKLYSPMATKVGGKATPEIKLGVPEQAEEHPEIIKRTKVGRDGVEVGYVVIDKGLGKGTLEVAYNPSIHASLTPLNDQFTSADIRPNLVIVETLIPKSELTSGYRAPMAKDAVGEMSWHSGTVSGKLAELGKPRRVILSRYDMPVRIVPFKEVAQMIAAQLEGTDIDIPYNVVTPQVGMELQHLGIAISDSPSGSVGESRDFGKAEYITDQEIERINAHQQEMAQTSPEAKSSHAEKLAKKFNTPIQVVADPKELTSDNAERQARMRRSKGFYDPSTGKVVVVLHNNADVEDVAETVFHEVVAHKGLREMIGEENYDAFCDEVYNHLKDDLKQQVDKDTTRRFVNEPSKGYEHHRRVAVDELFGRMAEKGFEDFTKAERGIWTKLKAKVLEAINKFLGSLKLPKWVRLGDNELRYILWRSHERLGARAKAQGQVQNEALDFVDMARDVAKRAELGLIKSDVIVTRSRKTTADMIEESFDAAVAGELIGKPVEIGRLTKEGREYLEKLSGLKLKEVVSFVLNPSDLVHMYRDHFGTNEKDKGNNIPLTKEDIRAIADVVSSPERVIFGKEPDGLKRNLFYFLAPAQEGAYNLLEIYGDRKGNLTAKTFYKTRKGVSQRVLSLMKSEHLTSVTDGATLSDGAKLPKFFDNSISEHEMIEYRFRDSETGDIWKDQSLGLKEKITYAALRLSKAQADDLTLRNDAMAAIGDNLKNLLHDMRNRRGTTQKFAGADHKVEVDIAKAKAAQLRYDRSTVKRVGDLARILMQTGYLSDMTSGEILRLMSAVKNSVGGNDIESSVDKIMDIMIGNQLRNAEDALHSLLSIRGSKVDSRGVEVQGELDIDGQRTIEVVKRTINLNEDDITSLMEDARDRMGDSDKIIADNAAIEYAGLNMALDYAQNIANSKAEENALRYGLKTANEDKKAGRLTENAYKQLVDSIDEAIRKNKIERAEAYFNLVGRLSGSLRESIENARAFRESEKARISDIHHNANSDMEGRPSNEHHKDDWKDKMANNGFVQFVLAPLGTFDQILRTFGNKSANGEGYLWNRFMRGWVDCRNKELLGVKNKFARLDEKVAEIFGILAKARGDSKKGPKVKSMADMIKLDGKLPTATVKFWDGGEMREHELTQGNLLYIYMVDKMTDGRMKLRRMGITEEDAANVEKALDPRFKEFGDWLQEEFLVDTRNEYNVTHKRIFGASMAAVENYFPLKILSNARTDKEEDVNQQGRPDGITTKTGSIIKRRTNSLALDIMGSNALSVVLDHITEMEHWNAYAEWNRDLNTLRTYKRFRNQVMNMTTAYGGGERLWKRFNDLCLMAAGEYRPPIAMLDKAAVNIAKGVTAAKVSFRIFTALKQFLSAPAYLPEVSTGSIAKSLANPYGDFKWCMENLPIFYERWHSRISGDPRLLKTDHDWKTWREGIVAVAARLGMTPNAFVDALTVSIGARAMYQTRLKRYLKEGYTDEEAEKRAKQDATILFNQTQQSSESPFLSTMQVDRSWLSVLFTVFRNSSMSYTRQEYDALRNLKRNLTPEQRAKSIEFMAKQILRDWDIDPDTATDAERDQAQSAAKKRFRRQLKKDVVRLATFGFILPLAWNLGAYLPYIIFGDDEDEKDKMWDDALTHSYFGSVEGLTGGDVMSSFGNMWASGEWNDRQLTKDMPLASDISTIINKFVGEKNSEAINDIINLAIQSGIGVNPQSITDVVVAITDACGDDPRLSHEAAICIMRILQVPQSQLDKMYFDEVGLSGKEVGQYTPGQLAQRYAEYKIMRGTPFVPWAWGDEELQSKYEKSAQKKIKERLAGREDGEVVAAYEDLDDRYKSFTKKISAVKEMMGTDYIAAAQEAAELQNDPDFKIYQKRNALDAALDKAMRKWPPQRRERVKDLRLESTVAGVPQSKLAIKASDQKKVSLTGELNRISNKYFTAETPEEARLIADTMAKYRTLMVDAMQTDSEAEQAAAISELSTLIHDFRAKEDEMRSTKR